MPTSPGRLPGVGHAVSLARGRLEFLQSLRDQGDVVRVYLGRRPVYVLNSPELVRRLLTAGENSPGRRHFIHQPRPVPGGALMSCRLQVHHGRQPTRQPWGQALKRSLRKDLRESLFRQEGIRRCVDIMSRETETVIGAWSNHRTLRIDREMHALTLRIAARSLCSAEQVRTAADECFRLSPMVGAESDRRAMSPFPWWEKAPTPGNRRFGRAALRLGQLIDEVVAAYRADGRDHGDLLSLLLAERDEEGVGRGLADARIRDEAVAIMRACTQTTAVALSWLFHELDRHSLVRERLHRELRVIPGAGPANRAVPKDIRNLRYTRQVIDETLRLHTPMWLQVHRITAPLDLGGQALSPGTEVLLSPTALHRDPAVYPDPMCFDPDRWSPERGRSVGRGAYLPFGIGPRHHVTEVFARTAMAVVTACVARRWRLTVPPGRGVREVASGSLRPDALRMTARLRTHLAEGQP
ncbi:cytochrome P450 [Streptomyces phyllanthi]|uniref:cytochrome P450 n=1 Tax=Streptomyces phyllanthi TaxID=1803180 RepID=UPI002AD2862F|nr:cytochrome P450 [Streptomyces phyllanthi]